MSDVIAEKVRKAVSDVFGVPIDEVSVETTADEVDGWDSFHMINLLMVLESEFGIKLKATDAKKMGSVRSIMDVLEERGVAA